MRIRHTVDLAHRAWSRIVETDIPTEVSALFGYLSGLLDAANLLDGIAFSKAGFSLKTCLVDNLGMPVNKLESNTSDPIPVPTTMKLKAFASLVDAAQRHTETIEKFVMKFAVSTVVSQGLPEVTVKGEQKDASETVVEQLSGGDRGGETGSLGDQSGKQPASGKGRKSATSRRKRVS